MDNKNVNMPHVIFNINTFFKEKKIHIGIIAEIIMTVIIFFYFLTRKLSKFLEYKRPLGS